MSFQDMILNSLSNLQTDGDLRGAFQHIINSGIVNDQNSWHPPVDIVDIDSYLYVYIEIPGVKDESISVEFFNNKLSISGEKIKIYNEISFKNEIVYGKFNRHISLPMNVTNKENVNLSYNNGILTVVIDKKNEEQNKFTVGISKNNL
jgi:HSP20 family molecular chaperone IbpA